MKVRDCLALKYDEEDRERIIALAGKFDELSSDQIGELMALLAT